MNDPQLNLDFSTRTFRLPQAGDTSEASEKAPVTKIELQPHSKIANRYVLLEIVGAGAFGSVFLATDLELQRNVAIKLSHARNPDERHLEAMRREARAAARFEHPHVVRVYDFGVHEQRPYIIYEYIQGESLQSLLARKHLDLRQALEILCKVADAMDVAHREGVFHRDLKPSNILVDDRFEPHVTDFGLALSYQEQQAHRGEVAGTLSYMSPEQIEGKAHFLDGRADIWSMGVMLYRVLTGRLPFTGTQAEISEQVLSRTPTPPRQINPAVPVALELLCKQCLEKDPDTRPSTIRDVAAGLRRYLFPLWRRRSFKIASAIGCVCLLFVVGLAYGFSHFKNRGRLADVLTEFQPGQVYDLLKVCRPEIVLQQGKRAECGMVNGELRVISEDTTLVKLCSTQEDAFRVSVTLRQPNEQGRAGIFFGLSERAGPEEPRTFEVLQLSRVGDNRFQLERAALTLSLGGGESLALSLPAPVEFHGKGTMEVRVSRDLMQPFRVFWNGQELPELQHRLLQVPMKPTGAVGVFSRTGVSYFQDCQFQIARDHGKEKK